MRFKRGDKVKYVSKCPDHANSFLKIGKIYRVADADITDYLLVEVSGTQDSHGFSWWVRHECVTSCFATKQEEICAKIIDMELRFKNRKKTEEKIPVTVEELREAIARIREGSYAVSL